MITITIAYPNGDKKTFQTTQPHLKTEQEARAEFEKVFSNSIQALGWTIVETKITPKKHTITHACKKPTYPGAPADEWDAFFLTESGQVIHVDYDDLDYLSFYSASQSEIEHIKTNHDPELAARWQPIINAANVK